jgi:hypothetical protein
MSGASPVFRRPWGGVWLVFCAVLLLARLSHAEDRVTRLAEQLASSDDFRIRTQAALALGASKSKRAVGPLCGALADSVTSVRAAAAAGLGKLALGGTYCLKKRLGEESSGSVKTTIKKALALLEAGGAEPEGPAVTASTRVYVAIARTVDKTGRNGNQVDEIVRGAMNQAASSLEGYAVAPSNETPGRARELLAKFKKIKGFYLAPKVMPPQYSGGNLVVKVEITIFTYPDRNLRGSLPIKLTQQDVSGKDPGAEDELIKMAAERAVEKFAQNADRIE